MQARITSLRAGQAVGNGSTRVDLIDEGQLRLAISFGERT
jgi:hypothetical protein